MATKAANRVSVSTKSVEESHSALTSAAPPTRRRARASISSSCCAALASLRRNSASSSRRWSRLAPMVNDLTPSAHRHGSRHVPEFVSPAEEIAAASLGSLPEGGSLVMKRRSAASVKGMKGILAPLARPPLRSFELGHDRQHIARKPLGRPVRLRVIGQGLRRYRRQSVLSFLYSVLTPRIECRQCRP